MLPTAAGSILLKNCESKCTAICMFDANWHQWLRILQRRHHEGIHATYLAGSVSYTYLCDVGFKNCKSKSELGHQKYEKYVLQFACLMQTGSNGCEIYKNVRMMHAVVFADRAPEAKNAQVMGENQNSKGFKKRKNSDRNGQKSDKSK